VHNSRAPARHGDYISYGGGAYFKIEIYRSIILPVVLYGCETWSLTLREERRLRVCESRVKVKQSHYSLDRPRGFQEVEAPRFQDNRHVTVVR
jgi:hypothetical protein